MVVGRQASGRRVIFANKYFAVLVTVNRLRPTDRRHERARPLPRATAAQRQQLSVVRVLIVSHVVLTAGLIDTARCWASRPHHKLHVNQPAEYNYAAPTIYGGMQYLASVCRHLSVYMAWWRNR